MNGKSGTSEYILYITVYEEEIFKENTPPYFEDWDDLMPIILMKGIDEYAEFTLPDPYDDDFDSIHIKVNLGSLKPFTTWHASS